ncbi:MAG: hypothetical protein J5818_02130 [Eggerthellaceae bacterium]|nr:hypothetical protein [Eggerthellaceae bacterium]
MKKILALLCASMLCVCCLALAACGGGASSSAASSSATSAASESASSAAAASSSATAASPEQLFAGEWKIAAMQTEGITIAGDFSMIIGDNDVVLNLNADGSANFTMEDETIDGTWKTTGGTAAELTLNDKTVPLSYEDDAVFMEMEDEDFSGTMIFTKDGTYAKMPEVTAEGAKAITSESELIGTWNLCAMNMMGISMYGDSDALSNMSGGTETTMTIEQGGKATLMGDEATWTVDASGASIVIDDVTIPVQKLDNGNLIVDLSAMLGGMEMIMVFSK